MRYLEFVGFRGSRLGEIEKLVRLVFFGRYCYILERLGEDFLMYFNS